MDRVIIGCILNRQLEAKDAASGSAAAQTPLARNQQPSEWGQIACFGYFGLHWSSPEYGDLRYNSGGSKETIWSHSGGWWVEGHLEVKGAAAREVGQLKPRLYPGVERIWHISDSQGRILALAFRQKSVKHFLSGSLFARKPVLLSLSLTHTHTLSLYVKRLSVKRLSGVGTSRRRALPRGR